ncbi:MAG TPA: hypothetical protein VLA72_00165 [Anaerolineales bacterium]|nr:hypothetical protein [Anaerolineales bacterium]
MDPISMALVSALTAGLVGGVTKIGESLVGDIYNALKSALSRKFGKKSRVVKSVRKLEADPGSDDAQNALSESIRESRADHDQELLQLAGQLSRMVIEVTQSAGDNAVQIGKADNMSGVIAQRIQGNVYNVHQGAQAPTAQALLMRGVGLVRARAYQEAATMLTQSLLAAPSGDGNYYLALALLQGKRPKILTYSQAVSIRQKLASACSLDSSKAHYWYLRALVEYDFFIENGFSDEISEIEDLLDAGDRCKRQRPFLAELLEHVPVYDNDVYEYLRENL